MSDGLRRIELTDDEWGDVKLLVAIPRDGDSWGILAPLRGTVWGDQVQIVSGDAVSHALHGWATPLMREIGVAPKVRAHRIDHKAGFCKLSLSCVGAGALCIPGPKMPDCYEAPGFDLAASLVASTVALAWRDGFYVVVVEGDGFVVL